MIGGFVVGVVKCVCEGYRLFFPRIGTEGKDWGVLTLFGWSGIVEQGCQAVGRGVERTAWTAVKSLGFLLFSSALSYGEEDVGV